MALATVMRRGGNHRHSSDTGRQARPESQKNNPTTRMRSGSHCCGRVLSINARFARSFPRRYRRSARRITAPIMRCRGVSARPGLLALRLQTSGDTFPRNLSVVWPCARRGCRRCSRLQQRGCDGFAPSSRFSTGHRISYTGDSQNCQEVSPASHGVRVRVSW